MNKLQNLLALIFTIFILVNVLMAKDKDCFEIKHLDFFGYPEDSKVNWPDDELDKLLELDFSDDPGNTNFLLPALVFQLRRFHPNCNLSTDKNRYHKLLSLYFKMRGKDISPFKTKTIAEQLLFVREDFYSQINNEKLLARMRYTMDDGPLYGEIPKSALKSKLLKQVSVDFGKLEIRQANEQILLVATNKQNKRIWSRILKGTNPERYLSNLEFDKVPLEKTPLATIVHFYSGGERLTLYLKPDGKFMYYYHSW